MDLHRRRRLAWVGAAMVVGGIVIAAVAERESETMSEAAMLLDWKSVVGGPVMVLVGILFLCYELRPFRCRIDEHGLTLRLPGESKLARSVGWGSIEAIMVEPSPDGEPRLVLVPAAGVDIGVPTEYRNGVDGRPSLILLNLTEVREQPDQVRAALQRYAGDRYVHVG